MNRLYLLLFLVHLLTRVAFTLLAGFFNNYSFQADAVWLVDFGLKAAEGDFNFELNRFVVSPLYPAVIGLFKIVSGENWNIVLILFQLLISALSGVYVYKIGLLLFNNKNIGLVASLLFSVFPMTLWFTHTFSQECLFQALFIFTMYFILKSIKHRDITSVIVSAILFSLTYLMKSHILLFSVFIPVIYFHYFKLQKETFVYSITFALISLLFSIPYGLYTYKYHHTYIISSNGAAYQFYLGNTEAGYKSIVDVPAKGSGDYIKIKDINVTAGYFNGTPAYYDSLLNLPQKEKQELFFNEGLNWIKSNPGKFIELKLYDILFFVVPGVNWKHYSLPSWLLSFIFSFPIYLLAYLAIIRLVINKDKAVIPIIYLFISMLLFSTIWYVQNRFRTITIEPFYVIYAAYALNELIIKFPASNKVLSSISSYFHRA